MINKKIELVLKGEKVQLWFNTFSKYELMGMYKANNEIEFAQRMGEKAQENSLLLLIDIVKAGIKGASLAKGEKTPDVYDNINMVFAEMEMEDTLKLWGEVFTVFNHHMGKNVKEEDKKKVVRKKKPQKKKS